MEQLMFQNPNPVLRAGADGRIIYSNAVSEALLRKWDTKLGGKLPDSVENLIKRVIKRGISEKTEVRVGKKYIL